MENLLILENIDLTTNELAYQLTAYENSGVIDYDAGINDLVVNEYIENAESYELIEAYNRYLEENDYYDDMYYSNDEDFFNTFFSYNPMEVARASFYGNYRYRDEYVKFNAYGNLESCEEWQLIRKIKDNNDFKTWLFENDEAFEELREEETKDSIIDMTLELVKKGF